MQKWKLETEREFEDGIDPNKYLDKVARWIEVKPERWKPKKDEDFYYIGIDGLVGICSFFNMKTFKDMVNVGNCFRTFEEAEAMRDKIAKMLRGE